MTDQLQGGCLCGASRYQAGAGKFAIRCYCRDCQHVSGGGHLPQVAVDADSLRHTGPIKTFGQKADSGSDLGFSFCGDCGAPLFKTTSKAPELAFLMVGSLDDPSGIEIGSEVFEAGRQPWDHS